MTQRSINCRSVISVICLLNVESKLHTHITFSSYHREYYMFIKLYYYLHILVKLLVPYSVFLMNKSASIFLRDFFYKKNEEYTANAWGSCHRVDYPWPDSISFIIDAKYIYAMLSALRYIRKQCRQKKCMQGDWSRVTSSNDVTGSMKILKIQRRKNRKWKRRWRQIRRRASKQ